MFEASRFVSVPASISSFGGDVSASTIQVPKNSWFRRGHVPVVVPHVLRFVGADDVSADVSWLSLRFRLRWLLRLRFRHRKRCEHMWTKEYRRIRRESKGNRGLQVPAQLNPRCQAKWREQEFREVGTTLME